MLWLWLFPVIGAVVLVAAGLRMAARDRRIGASLDALLQEAGAADAFPDTGASGGNDMYLTVRILNPLEVASNNSRLAGPISGVAPGLLRRQVYDQMSNELQQELAGYGIEAEIAVQRCRS